MLLLKPHWRASPAWRWAPVASFSAPLRSRLPNASQANLARAWRCL